MPLFNNQYNWWDYPQLNQQGLRSMLFQQQPELPQQAVIPPQQPIYSEMKVPQIPLRPEIPDNYQNYWDFPSGLFQYRKDVISPNHPIYGEESPTQSDMAGIEPYNIKEDPLIANLPTPQETTPDPYQFGLSPQDNKNSLIQALLGFGMGTLAANKPGTTGGQAIGAGGLTGLQQYGTATQSALKQNLEKYQAQKLAEQMALSQQQETRKNLIESANLGLAMKKDLREEAASKTTGAKDTAATAKIIAETEGLNTPLPEEIRKFYADKGLNLPAGMTVKDFKDMGGKIEANQGKEMSGGNDMENFLGRQPAFKGFYTDNKIRQMAYNWLATPEGNKAWIDEQKRLAGIKQLGAPPIYNLIPTAEGYTPANIRTGELGKTTGVGKPMPNEMVTAAQQIETLKETLGRVKTLYKDSYVGAITGRIAGIAEKTIGVSAEQAQFNSDLAQTKNSLIYLMSGKQINESEYTRLLEQLPDKNLPPTVFKARMGNFEKTLDSIIENRQKNLGGYGVPAETKKVNKKSGQVGKYKFTVE